MSQTVPPAGPQGPFDPQGQPNYVAPQGQSYGQPPQGPPPYGPPNYAAQQPPAQPPKKKGKLKWWILGIIAAIVVISVAVNGGKSDDKSDNATNSAPVAGAPAAPAGEASSGAPGLGSEVRDGKFGFVVTAVDPPVKTLGDNQFMQKTAQGDYVVVHVDVTNTSNKPQSYFSQNQKLIDTQGREFTNDSMAGININDQTALMADINPGNKLSVAIAFDVPPGTQPSEIELHDSMFSGGVKASLK